MAINLLAIQPHKVSRDLSGYITLLYGPAKVGKTTFGAQMPGELILATERGYNALPGVIVQDITSWSDIKQVVRELKKPEIQAVYKSLIIDTIDLAADMCQKYVCNQLGIENIGDGGWTNNGWDKYKREFEDVFRTLAQLGYAILFISHDKEITIKPENGIEYQQIRSSMQTSALKIVENMSDIIAYAHPVIREGQPKRILTLRSADNSIRCGCRFKYMVPEIDFSYDNLVKALNDAIDKEAAETGGKFVTEERIATIETPTYDYDALINEFATIAGELMNKEPTYYQPRITQIVEKYLGKGKKVADTTRDQAEFLYLIVTEIKSDLMK